ncbi:MAG: type II toxin-antitoxin system RelE/ParE family toxin [Clostridiales bacterium]|jgi:mRNA-degrading endonuclease RelE of RelBE toxin-antitoxin system|nr:type II toxin-antitoxin system RelE/ParE family toxin [Clostridiales bacterium]
MEVKYSKQAERFLDKLDEKTAKRITSRIEKLPYGDVKKLRNSENTYRLRVGGHRIRFIKNGRQFFITEIETRANFYKMGVIL